MGSSQSCQVTYQRIVKFNEKDPAKDRTPRSSPRQDVTDEELKYCFYQIVLEASILQRWDDQVYSEHHTVIMIDALDELKELDELGWRWACRQCHTSNSANDTHCSNCRNSWRD